MHVLVAIAMETESANRVHLTHNPAMIIIVMRTWTGVGCLIPNDSHVFTRCGESARSANELGAPDGVASSFAECARRSSGESSRDAFTSGGVSDCLEEVWRRFFLLVNKRNSMLPASSVMAAENVEKPTNGARNRSSTMM